MIIRILGVQAETDLGLRAYMKVVLRMVSTMSTILPITMNPAIRTAYSIMKHIGLNGFQKLLECLCCYSNTQILLKSLKDLRHL